MQDFIIPGTKKTPHIEFNVEKGTMELKGHSIMEDTIKFYQPMMEWVNNYVNNPKDTVVNVDLEYFNTSSSKILLQFFKNLAKIKEYGCRLDINWCFEADDLDAIDSGQNFSRFSQVEFNFVEKN
jgi:hypothetical protein